jgi:hypothetical protein
VPGASYQLWFAVRYVHIVSVALLTGGAVFAAVSCETRGSSGTRADIGAIFHTALAYEWTFWSVVGVTAATGVSNLGLKGEGLLGPETSWGTALSVKLGAVLLLLALSFIRSDIVARCNDWSSIDGDRVRRVLTVLYGITALTLFGALWLGLGLAHGRY